ncbi:MAG: amidohydrolase family protein [Gammaproteobacteria bacterium]|nr:amidohydrolase family protein [Gammaproteobacteria bacterium]
MLFQNRHLFRTVLLILVTGTGSHSVWSQDTDKLKADMVLHKGIVYTVNEKQKWAQALAINSGKIIYVGNNEGAKAYIGKQTKVLDLKNRLILPGFHDAHVHPMEGISLSTFMSCDLYEIKQKYSDIKDWIEPLRECGEREYPHSWILGGGHDNSDLFELETSPREFLDNIFPDKPVAFMEKSSHSMWVNSKALERVGIDRNTPHPQGGKIFKDPHTGKPIGILTDSAGDELMHKALAKSPALQEARYQAVLGSQDYLVSYGITSAVNARVYWTRGNLEPWLRAKKEGRLKARNVMSLWAYPHLDDDMQLSEFKSMYQDDKSSLLRVSQIKFYSDGVADLNSGAVLKPYGYLIHPDAEARGGNYITEKRLTKMVSAIQDMGFGAIIHAIGDRGVREALNAIEAAQKDRPDMTQNQPRHYISHVNWVSDRDIGRFAELNVPADTQINYIKYEDYLSGEDDYYTSGFMVEVVKNNESDLAAMSRIISTGARLVISSDWDVANIDPLFSIQNATQEFLGAESTKGVMTEKELLELAVKAYTYNAAYAMNQETLTGSLEVGKYADLIVLDKNIFELPVYSIRDSKVLWTLVAGEEVYRADKLHAISQ